MQFFQDWSDMAWLSGQSYNTSCCVLYVLKTRYLILRETIQKSIPVIEPWCDKGIPLGIPTIFCKRITNSVILGPNGRYRVLTVDTVCSSETLEATKLGFRGCSFNRFHWSSNLIPSNLNNKQLNQWVDCTPTCPYPYNMPLYVCKYMYTYM